MGKLTTATWVPGAMLALGHLSLVPNTAKADYATYYPQEDPYQIQRASYQPNNQRVFNGWTPKLDVPPDLQPYTDNNNQGFYNPKTETYRAQSYQPAQPSYQVAAPQTPVRSKKLNPTRKEILKTAYQSLGITYRWGGNTPREGFDCSGLTKFTHKNVHLSIPRTALEQSRASRTINRRDLKPGDMIFFRTSGKKVNHVGIYVGDGKFIHAASGGGKVTLDDLRRAYWQQRLVKYGTFLA
ncbi:C40 family peptidase [uncultured Thiothrix sp.]|uniref:C40 family peptidase n=1 Tax=uncultured Thiothrix sp. TaxID=223185 RepID=UPI00262F2B1B|nr:C40 family peptidase [uncultured Thiothrix sp.]HMT92893.1 C40 family peptidase [Thiolinea sp.]